MNNKKSIDDLTNKLSEKAYYKFVFDNVMEVFINEDNYYNTHQNVISCNEKQTATIYLNEQSDILCVVGINSILYNIFKKIGTIKFKNNEIIGFLVKQLDFNINCTNYQFVIVLYNQYADELIDLYCKICSFFIYCISASNHNNGFISVRDFKAVINLLTTALNNE